MLRTELPAPTRPARAPLDLRERVAAGSAAELGDAELLAVLLATGSRDGDAHDLARQLLARLGDLPRIARASAGELRGQPGIGPAKASRVLAALELGRRAASCSLDAGDPIRASRQVADAYRPRLAHLDREHFFALLLDAKHRKIRDHCVSVGCLDSAIVHPREVFRPAVAESAAAVILVHNHPSGDPTPSAEDRAVTRRLASAAGVLGVELLDHVIVARQGTVSLRDLGEL